MKFHLTYLFLTITPTLAFASALTSCGNVACRCLVQNIIGVPPKEGNTCP